MGSALTCNFNEKTLLAAVNRITDMHVINDPVLLNVKDGMYAVHDAHGLDTIGQDNIQIYSKAEYEDKFGGQNIMTLNQLESDFESITKNRIGGPVDSNFWAEKQPAMEYRLEQIEQDAQKLGVNLDHDICAPVGPNMVQ